MAEPLNWILNDSQQAARVYAGLIDASKVDSKMWDFVEIRKDHEKLAGSVKRKLDEIGVEPVDKSRNIWPEVNRHKALRLYDDPDALQALRDAEQAELEECRKLLNMSSSARMVETFVSSEVMPVLSAHVDTLNGYLQQAQAQSRAQSR